MQYRRLGRTNLQVSVLGLGAGYLSVVDRDLGTALFERALAAGVNYIDGRYGDSNEKLAPVIKGRRSEVVIASKTNDQTGDGARRRIEEDLRDLDTDYIDVYQVRAYTHDMLAGHLAPGGSVEALEKAKAEGLIRAIGVTGHSSMPVLTDAIKTGRIDTVLFPLNILQDEAWASLIPTARAMDVGLVIMKPLATGIIPTELALRWLFAQPISTAVPGVTTMEQLEANLAVAEMSDWTLSPAEMAEVLRIRAEQEGRICRGCDDVCGPFPVEGVSHVSFLIFQGVSLNHLRNFGTEGFRQHRWASADYEHMVQGFRKHLADTRGLLKAGMKDVEARCPYGVRVTDLLEETEGRLQEFLTAAESAER